MLDHVYALIFARNLKNTVCSQCCDSICGHVMQVESLSSHASSTSPPPADKECPLKPHMQETDRLLLTGALVEMEYTYKVK